MEWKFFTKDIVSGKADKVGDRFTAVVFGGKHEFEVTQLSHGCIMAVMVGE